MCDLFFEVRGLEYASFADDTTPYSFADDTTSYSFADDTTPYSFADDTIPYSCLPEMIHILEKLEKGIQSMLDLFSENFSKASAYKCHLNASSKVPIDIQISDIKVTTESTFGHSYRWQIEF